MVNVGEYALHGSYGLSTDFSSTKYNIRRVVPSVFSYGNSTKYPSFGWLFVGYEFAEVGVLLESYMIKIHYRDSLYNYIKDWLYNRPILYDLLDKRIGFECHSYTSTRYILISG